METLFIICQPVSAAHFLAVWYIILHNFWACRNGDGPSAGFRHPTPNVASNLFSLQLYTDFMYTYVYVLKLKNSNFCLTIRAF